MDNILKKEIDDFMKILINKIKQKVPKHTGSLFNSISYIIKGNNVSILMEYYGKFVDQGVSGVKYKYNTPFSYKDKKPPILAIKPWAKSKNINPFALQNSIYYKGIRPQNFFKSIYEDYMNDSIDELVKSFADSIEKEIDKKLK